MRTKKIRKLVKYPIRSFRVDFLGSNKVRYFDDVDVNCGGLKGFSGVVHAAFQLGPLQDVLLIWYSDTLPFHLSNNEEFFEMWDKGVVEDGYVHLYMNIRHRKKPLSDECPSTSGVTNGITSTPVKLSSNSRMHINFEASPVTLDPSMFVTPKKRIIYSKAPDLIRRSPRLVGKSIASVSDGGVGGSVCGKKLHFNMYDEDDLAETFE